LMTARSTSTQLAPDTHINLVLDGGFRMRFLAVNPGPPESIMFLHGGGVLPELYDPLLRRLATDRDVTVYAPYLPNHGHGSRVSSYAELIFQVGQAAEKLGMSGSVFVGHSAGGHISTCLAADRPDLVSAVVGLSTPMVLPSGTADLSRLGMALAADASITFGAALWASLLNGSTARLSSALGDMMLISTQLADIRLSQRGAPDLRDIIPFLAQPVTFLKGGADFALTDEEPDFGPNIIRGKLRGMPHNFPVWPASHGQISVAVGRALGRAGSLAPVIPLPVVHLDTAAASYRQSNVRLSGV
jgi:pimeloyl-ACP methyl ester carboxylesterase